MPCLSGLLGGPLVLNGSQEGEVLAGDDWTLCALDACLGVPGLPQSATGQTSLFTGVNAQALVGEHVSAHPTTALREIIAEHSVLKQAAAAGARVIFANAHSDQFWTMIRKRRRRLGASTLTALAGEATIPTLSDLVEGHAVLWDITHEVAVQHLDYDLPLVSPEEAGRRLAHLSDEYDLVLYESFLTDLAGHRRVEPDWVLTRLDAFLGSVLAQRRADTTVVLSSDHGNIEDATTKLHSMNPVPLLAVGPDAGRFRRARAITDVTPAILSCLAGRPEMDGDGRG